MRLPCAISACVLLALAGCSSEKPAPAPAPAPSSAPRPSPSGPSLPTTTAVALVPDFTGRGEQPVPVFTSGSYTVRVHCVGGGPLRVLDTTNPQVKPYVSTCDGRGNQIMTTLPKPAAVHLRIVAEPSSDWEARVEAR